MLLIVRRILTFFLSLSISPSLNFLIPSQIYDHVQCTKCRSCAHICATDFLLAVAAALNIVGLLSILAFARSTETSLLTAGVTTGGVKPSWAFTAMIVNVAITLLFVLLLPLMAFIRYRRDGFYVQLSKEEVPFLLPLPTVSTVPYSPPG